MQAADRLVAEQEEIIRWAEQNPEGAEITDAKGQRYTYDAAQVRTIRSEALLKHARAAAAREAKANDFARVRQAEFHRHHAEAAQQFPWMARKTSPEYQEALEIVRKAPGLLSLPNHEILLGYMVEGKRSVTAKAKASKLTPAVVPAPRVPGVRTATPPTTRITVDPAAKALKRIQSGDERGVEEYFAAHLNGRAA